MNGEFLSHFFSDHAAWSDFLDNPEHVGQEFDPTLRAGPNRILVKVRGGSYAGSGFFMAVLSESSTGRVDNH